ncbi:MAG: FkbM family methyltransferase [Myxococcota bacterium]
MTESQLIYDLGLHLGEDSEFYLKKGFRVVGIDANPEMCAQAGARLASYVETGQLVIVNRAIAMQEGEVTFYRNQSQSEWGTIDATWAERNRRIGTKSEEIRVQAVTLKRLVDEHGPPYFVKIDIEGLDLTALRSLTGAVHLPKYVSIESDKVSFSRLREEFDVFKKLGYDRFKIVPQHRVPQQRPPYPAREGRYVEHEFELGSSGLFGEEAPGEWLTASQAIELYKPIFIRYQLTGDDPLIRSRVVRGTLKRLGFRTGWHDTHARLATNGG